MAKVLPQITITDTQSAATLEAARQAAAGNTNNL